MPSLLGPDLFKLLNEDRHCSTANDWCPADAAKLWIYNLHYFDDLNARDAAARSNWHANLLIRWIAENPAGQGNGWEPYPVSRRIVNWVKWAARGNALPAAVEASLAVQARWLVRRLEYHILGNHLLANAKALLYAGMYFEGAEAERWRARAMHILERQLHEQILADGGHFELSTMYHAAVLEDLLDLLNLFNAYERRAPDSWITAIAQMRRWLHIMSHPDGEIAFFNDAAFGIAPTVADLDAYAKRLDLATLPDQEAAVVTLDSSGYVRVRAGEAFLVCDCAPVGADHLLGHAHADTLSFEFSLGGQRVFVNSGTSLYGTSRERQRQRGTAAHNTVVVDGKDSSEVWAGFRVARRSRVTRRAVSATALGAIVEASHDGYRRLHGRNEHRRRWTIDDSSFYIEDMVSGPFQTAAAYFHLHPDIEARQTGVQQILLNGPDGTSLSVHFAGTGAVELLAGTWHPRFGVEIANRCIVARFAGSTLTTRVSWAGIR